MQRTKQRKRRNEKATTAKMMMTMMELAVAVTAIQLYGWSHQIQTSNETNHANAIFEWQHDPFHWDRFSLSQRIMIMTNFISKIKEFLGFDRALRRIYGVLVVRLNFFFDINSVSDSSLWKLCIFLLLYVQCSHDGVSACNSIMYNINRSDEQTSAIHWTKETRY